MSSPRIVIKSPREYVAPPAKTVGRVMSFVAASTTTCIDAPLPPVGDTDSCDTVYVPGVKLADVF